MKFWTFLENMSGFLFHPSQMIKENIKKEDLIITHRTSHIFVIYLSILLGVSIWFFGFYPEPLYYGILDPTAYYNIYTLEMSRPLYLFINLLVNLMIFYIIIFIVIGIFNVRVLNRITKQMDEKKVPTKTYLTLYAFSFTPLLFSVPIIALFIFFFEKLWIDLNLPTMIFILAIGFLFIWQWIIEVKINKIIFNTSIYRAATPTAIRLMVLLILGITFVIVYPLLMAYAVSNLGGVG